MCIRDSVAVLSEGDYKVIKSFRKDGREKSNDEELDAEALAELKRLEREK